MKTTLLIVTFNRFDLLERLLFSIQIQTKVPDQVVIVDNSNWRLQMQRCIDSNDYRYKQKWGGGPGNEIYKKPFNLKKFCVCGES